MAISLSAATLRLLDGRNYAVLATVNPDGSPHTSAMWVGRDGDDLLFSTVEGHQRPGRVGLAHGRCRGDPHRPVIGGGPSCHQEDPRSSAVSAAS
ncbi:MAG TPA: pyridoxamine 5'-phosphate oxidase family protein [Streptosporangiaceae bacterium]|nr:pyridoxamine 5'-phosphate oxidase family protein [Streptosporangiaceae bacterium]